MADKIVCVVFLVYLLGCLKATKTESTKKLVIDHDGGADDAFAITLSLLNEKYFDGPKLVALTTTFGNVDLNQTIINSDRILAAVDRQDVPIYVGAYHALISELESDVFYGQDGLGDDGYKPCAPIKVQDMPAAVALLELSKQYEGELIIVAIGPITNIALAARMDPNFIDRLAHLYVGGGHIYSETYPTPEFNANMDPEAYHIAADTAALDKVTFIPFSQIRLTLNASLVPIYVGAYHALISELESDVFYGQDGLGDDGYKPCAPIKVQDMPAAVALLELSKQYEGELIIVAIGPITNIALAARMDPNFIDRLAHLYVGGGHIYSETYPTPEFNANMDPEAYHIAADTAALDKVTFIPFSQIRLTLNASLDYRNNVLGKIDTPLMQALNGFERISLPKKNSWTPLDPAVAAIALNNNLVDTFKNVKNGIILEGEKRGINTNDFSSANPNGRLVYAANLEKYEKFLLDLYSAELKS